MKRNALTKWEQLIYKDISLVGFYGISNFVGYLMLNPVYTYILNIWLVNEELLGDVSNKPELICLHTIKWFQVLYQIWTILFSCFKHCYLILIVLFE